MPYQGTAANNPSGSVGVVHTSAARAPLDLGTGAGGLMNPVFTQVAGESGTPGANLPVEDLEQASNAIQRGRADLARTAGAEDRLAGFDGVGGGGGAGAVAQGTADENVSDQDGGLGAQRADGAQALTGSSLPAQDPRA